MKCSAVNVHDVLCREYWFQNYHLVIDTLKYIKRNHIYHLLFAYLFLTISTSPLTSLKQDFEIGFWSDGATRSRNFRVTNAKDT